MSKVKNRITDFSSKKITKTTLKSFLKEFSGKLYIKESAKFSIDSDCNVSKDNEFIKVLNTPNFYNSYIKLDGVLIYSVGNNFMEFFENSEFYGIKVSHCSGRVIVAIKK
jgi:hypothetical protein